MASGVTPRETRETPQDHFLAIEAERDGVGKSRARGSAPNQRLLATQRVLDAANGVLHLAGGLVGLAFGFKLGVAQSPCRPLP